MSAEKVQCCMYLEKELVAKIDRLAVKCKMNRSQFIAAFIEVTIESETPYIDFAVEMKRVARAIWPEKKSKVAKTA